LQQNIFSLSPHHSPNILIPDNQSHLQVSVTVPDQTNVIVALALSFNSTLPACFTVSNHTARSITLNPATHPVANIRINPLIFPNLQSSRNKHVQVAMTPSTGLSLVLNSGGPAYFPGFGIPTTSQFLTNNCFAQCTESSWYDMLIEGICSTAADGQVFDWSNKTNFDVAINGNAPVTFQFLLT
jgi:hypothetical protein